MSQGARTNERAVKKLAKLIYQAKNAAEDLDDLGASDLVDGVDRAVIELEQTLREHLASDLQMRLVPGEAGR